MKVLIIVPWFGPWPDWFPYFLQGCRGNPGFNFLLVSDNKSPESLSENIQFMFLELPGFNALLSDKLKMQSRVIHPYKICDYRPAFGNIFEDHLEGYDYWGYSDLDLVYGNLNGFLDDVLKEGHDVISVREEYMTGHFALYRNTETNRMLYRHSPIYKKVFTDPLHHYAFDERGPGQGKRLMKAGSSGSLHSLYGSLNQTKSRIFSLACKGKKLNNMSEITQQLANQGSIQNFWKTMVRSDNWYIKQGVDHWEVRWEEGDLTESMEGKKLLHFHFLKSKYLSTFEVEDWKPNSGFVISPGGIRIQ